MPPLRVAVVARSVFPLHGYGGLERHVYDLVRHLAAADVQVTLITRPFDSPDSALAPFDSPLPRLAHGEQTGDRGLRTTPAFARTQDERATARPRRSFSPGSQARSGGGDYGPRVRVLSVPYRTFPFAGRRGTTILDRSTAYPLFGERAGKLAWELVQAGDIDIVHGLGASVLGYARRRAESPAPLVLNPQGLEEFGATDPSRARVKRAFYLPLRRAVLACARAADRVIATDRILEPALLQHLHVPAGKVRLIPNALDLTVVDSLASRDSGERMRTASGLAPDDIVLLSVGRLEANKGFGIMADAIVALSAHGAPLQGRWRWVLIGDGPNRRSLEQAIDRGGLREHVVMTGRLPDADLHAWYEAATLFVHPTLYEGSSLVTLEAMAHRKAVVASNAGGLPDKVRNGVNGWLVEPGQPGALAAAISGALGQPPERLRAMGDASRQIVEREFAWPAVARNMLEMYGELV